MNAPTHSLIAKMTVQNLLQQIHHAEILLAVEERPETILPAALRETLLRIRQQLHDLDYRLQLI